MLKKVFFLFLFVVFFLLFFVFSCTKINLKNPDDVSRVNTNNKKILLVSDLHPERGKNNAFIKYLKEKEKSHIIYFLGDSRQWPDYYKEIKHIPVLGNHEWELTSDTPYEIILNDKILLIHGHYAENRFSKRYIRTIKDVANSFGNILKHFFVSKKIPLGTNHIVKKEKEIEFSAIKPEKIKVLKKLTKVIKKRFPKITMVFRGHDHSPYKIKVLGVLFYNCGAGFNGDHITIENNQIFFHSFE